MLFHDNSIKFQFPEKSQRLFKLFGIDAPKDPRLVLRALMAYRNETVLHRRKCDATGELIISAYKPETTFPVYKNDYWWSDAWNPLKYGREFDFSKTFFEQFAELQTVVPREGTSVFNSENCEYNGHIRDSRNCYMSSLVAKCEDTHYSYWCANNKDVVDSHVTNESTLCYECIDCKNLYESIYCQECVNSRNCYFSYQLVGCENCIGCSNLSHKKYWAFNEKVTPEQFNKIKQQIFKGERKTWLEGKEFFNQMFAQADHRALHNLNCENCVGDHLLDSKNCYMSFDLHGCEDSTYCISGTDSKDICCCYSAGWTGCEEIFSSAVSRGSSDIMCCYYTFYSSGLRYCEMSMNCSDCFACIGLKRASNCVLNKQYSKSDYEKLTKKIITHMKETGEWGKFFPPTCSSFSYNETAAQEYWPLMKAEAIKLGYSWNDSLDDFPDVDRAVISPDRLPTSSKESCDKIYKCSATSRPFRVVPKEWEFYKKFSLPLPSQCPQERRKSRIHRRNPYIVKIGKCSKTSEKIFTSYTTDNITILSEKAFLESIL